MKKEEEEEDIIKSHFIERHDEPYEKTGLDKFLELAKEIK